MRYISGSWVLTNNCLVDIGKALASGHRWVCSPWGAAPNMIFAFWLKNCHDSSGHRDAATLFQRFLKRQLPEGGGQAFLYTWGSRMVDQSQWQKFRVQKTSKFPFACNIRPKDAMHPTLGLVAITCDFPVRARESQSMCPESAVAPNRLLAR